MRRCLALTLALLLYSHQAAAQITTGGACAMLRTEEGDILVGAACAYDFAGSDFDVSCAAGECDIAASASIMRTTTSVQASQLPASVWMTADGTAPTVTGSKTASFVGTDYQNTATSSTNSIDKTGVRFRSTGSWNGTAARNFALRCSATGGTTNVCFWAEDSAMWQSPAAAAGYANWFRVNQANATGSATTTAPGILFWDGSASNFGSAGINLGSRSGTRRMQLFGGAFHDVCLSKSPNAAPVDEDDWNDWFCVTSGGLLQWFTPSTLYTFTLNGDAARSIGLARHTTANTAGSGVTIAAGGATSGATDKDGGEIALSPGAPTGTGRALGKLKAFTSATTTGTGDGTSSDAFTWGAFKALTDGSATNLVNATVASNSAAAGRIDYAVEVFNGTDVQVETGSVLYHVTNKGGTVANNTITEVDVQQASTSGTLSTTWAISAANPAVISLNADSSLTPSSGYPRVRYTLTNLTGQAVAVQ